MPADGLGRGVVVLGMHRSGTSAVTGVIDALGLHACLPDDRMPARRWNARGNFESRSISRFDEALLQTFGGSWFAPPTFPDGWASDERLAGARAEAAALSAVVPAHPFAQWVWKDPRACVLMPFWDLVLGRDLPRIVVLRNPVESAASLEARNGMPSGLALALAERSLHAAFEGSAGRPVLITRYDDLLEDLGGWCRVAAGFIRTAGLSLPDPLAVDRAQGFVEEGLRHHRAETDLGPESGATEALRRIWEWALERNGVHDALSTDGLPDESQDTGDRLRAAAPLPIRELTEGS